MSKILGYKYPASGAYEIVISNTNPQRLMSGNSSYQVLNGDYIDTIGCWAQHPAANGQIEIGIYRLDTNTLITGSNITLNLAQGFYGYVSNNSVNIALPAGVNVAVGFRAISNIELIGVSLTAGYNTEDSAANGTVSLQSPFVANTIENGTGYAVYAIIDNSNAPQLSNINNGNSLLEFANVSLTGNNFGSSMIISIVQGNVTINQANISIANSNVAYFTLDMEPGTGKQLGFDANANITTIEIINSYGNTNITNVSLMPPLGLLYANIVSLNTNSSAVFSNIAANDQIEASGNSTGTANAPPGLVINYDGTWEYLGGYTPQNFYARLYDSANNEWSGWALQSIISSNVNTNNASFGYYYLDVIELDAQVKHIVLDKQFISCSIDNSTNNISIIYQGTGNNIFNDNFNVPLIQVENITYASNNITFNLLENGNTVNITVSQIQSYNVG